MIRKLFGGIGKECVNKREGNGSEGDDEACCYGAPQHIGASKSPNREQRSQYGDRNASAGYPKSDTSNQCRIYIASMLQRPLRVFRSILHGLTLTGQSTLIDRNVRKVVLAKVLRSRPNQFVIGILLEDMSGPAANSTDREDWSIEL
jgi:hypothetical protein